MSAQHSLASLSDTDVAGFLNFFREGLARSSAPPSARSHTVSIARMSWQNPDESHPIAPQSHLLNSSVSSVLSDVPSEEREERMREVRLERDPICRDLSLECSPPTHCLSLPD